MCVHVSASLCMWMCLCVFVCVCVYICMCIYTCVCMPVSVQSACVSVHVGTLAHTKHMWMHVCVWRTLGKVNWKHHQMQHIPSPSTCCLLGTPSSEGQALEMIIWHTLLISEHETTEKLLQRPVHGNSGSHSTTTTVCQQAHPFTSIPHWPSG